MRGEWAASSVDSDSSEYERLQSIPGAGSSTGRRNAPAPSSLHPDSPDSSEDIYLLTARKEETERLGKESRGIFLQELRRGIMLWVCCFCCLDFCIPSSPSKWEEDDEVKEVKKRQETKDEEEEHVDNAFLLSLLDVGIGDDAGDGTAQQR